MEALHRSYTINMAPADIKKEGSAFDLPLAIGMLAGGEKLKSKLLAHYMIAGEGRSLEDWLDQEVFSSEEGETLQPDPVDAAGFKAFLERYKKGLAVERAAVENIPGGA